MVEGVDNCHIWEHFSPDLPASFLKDLRSFEEKYMLMVLKLYKAGNLLFRKGNS